MRKALKNADKLLTRQPEIYYQLPMYAYPRGNKWTDLFFCRLIKFISCSSFFPPYTWSRTSNTGNWLKSWFRAWFSKFWWQFRESYFGLLPSHKGSPQQPQPHVRFGKCFMPDFFLWSNPKVICGSSWNQTKDLSLVCQICKPLHYGATESHNTERQKKMHQSLLVSVCNVPVYAMVVYVGRCNCCATLWFFSL